MKKLLEIIFLIVLTQSVYSQTFSLTIKIPNLSNQKGKIQIGIYDNKADFPKVDKQFKVIYLEANKFTGTYTISNLPQGDYAVALMHDENADNICNTNLLGIPKEGYGFSKNYKPKLSAPSFDDCKIVLNRNLILTIELIY